MSLDQKTRAEALRRELEYVDPDKRVHFLRERLSSVTDDEERHEIQLRIMIYGEVMGFDDQGNPCHLIVAVHGIRTYSLWSKTLESRAADKIPNSFFYTASYGWFDVVSFWLPFRWLRDKKIRKVAAHIRWVTSQKKGAKLILVAHSFGTYIVSHVMRDCPDINVDRLLLCGAIVDESFRWETLPKFPHGEVLNDCGTRDFYPFLAKALSFGYGISGAIGFESTAVVDRFHDLDHSGFFSESHIDKYWLPFLKNGEKVSSDWDHLRSSPSWITSVSVLWGGLIPKSLMVVVPSLVLLVGWFFLK